MDALENRISESKYHSEIDADNDLRAHQESDLLETSDCESHGLTDK